MFFTPRPLRPKGYCRCPRPSVCPSVRLSVRPAVPRWSCELHREYKVDLWGAESIFTNLWGAPHKSVHLNCVSDQNNWKIDMVANAPQIFMNRGAITDTTDRPERLRHLVVHPVQLTRPPGHQRTSTRLNRARAVHIPALQMASGHGG